MSTIEVAVAGRGIHVKQGYEKPSSGDVNTCAVSLAIDSGGVWDDLPHKRVTFSTRTASVTVDYAPTITIPHEVLASPGALYLTLTGYDADGIEVARTHRMTYPIEVARAGADEGADPSPATLDVVSRIDALAADLEEKRDTDYWRGAPGAPGEPGEPGYSPTANVTKVGGTATITVTDKNGTTTATVSDGAPGSDAESTDVRINGNSITANGVADIPIANGDTAGVILTDDISGGYSTGLITAENRLWLRNADNSKIANRNIRVPILANNMDYAVKAAMCDGKGAEWTADEQKAARERINAADANKVYIMQKQIANLQGIAATEETDSTEAYTKTVPTGAQKWASLDKVGGKTVVLNQMFTTVPSATLEGITTTYDATSGTLSCIGTMTKTYFFIVSNTLVQMKDHKYYIRLCDGYTFTIDDGHTNSQKTFNTSESILSFTTTGTNLFRISIINSTEHPLSIGDSVNITFKPMLVDLTQMFGAGNEPSTVEEFRAMFPADYYPYNPGELMSAEVVEVESKGTFPIPAEVRDMCPGYGWSAGTVCNEIDFGRKVYVQRVDSVDLGTISYWNGSTAVSGKYRFGSEGIQDVKPSTHNVLTKDLRYNASTYNCVDGIEISTGGAIYIFDSRYEEAAAFKSAMQGVMLYYELATPIEVDISDVLPDDHYIEVEAGGTITFKQAATQLPIPSSVTYQISTKEVVANA